MNKAIERRFNRRLSRMAPDGPRAEYMGMYDSLVRAEVHTPQDLLAVAADRAHPMRGDAAWLLGFLDYRFAAPALVRIFADVSESHADRRCVAIALSHLRSKRVTMRLLRILRTDPGAEIRQLAAYILGWTGDVRAAATIIEVLLDDREDDGVRGEAAHALGVMFHWCSPLRRLPEYLAAVAALVRAGESAAPEVRFWCCYSLGVTADISVVPVLELLAASDHAKAPGAPANHLVGPDGEPMKVATVAAEAAWALAEIAVFSDKV